MKVAGLMPVASNYNNGLLSYIQNRTLPIRSTNPGTKAIYELCSLQTDVSILLEIFINLPTMLPKICFVSLFRHSTNEEKLEAHLINIYDEIILYIDQESKKVYIEMPSYCEVSIYLICGKYSIDRFEITIDKNIMIDNIDGLTKVSEEK